MTANADRDGAASVKGQWSLDPDVVYLNHGSFGACPRAVLDRQRALRARLESEPVRFFLRECAALVEESRDVLAQFVGASPRDLVFVSNATEGVNAVLRSLTLEPGESILVTDHGYAACVNAARYVAERAGAHVQVAEIPWPGTDEDMVVEAVLAAVDETTRLAVIDHVTSRTGMVLPIKRLVERLAERGVETLVDGAHAPGMVDLDVASIGAAYYAANCHKWLCAPKGAAFLVVEPSRQASVVPVVISHGWSAPAPRRYQAMFDWTGTRDLTPWACVATAIETMAGLHDDGWDGVRRSNRQRVLEARSMLCARFHAAQPCPDAMLGSLAAVPLPAGIPAGGGDLEPLQNRLWEEGIEVPILRHPGFTGRICRVSAQLYNTAADYEVLAATLAEAIASEMGSSPGESHRA